MRASRQARLCIKGTEELENVSAAEVSPSRALPGKDMQGKWGHIRKSFACACAPGQLPDLMLGLKRLR